MIVKTEGIVLKTFDFRETSRIATFFTRDFGKVKGVLKGIRRDPQKFGSSVEKFSVNDIVYYQYRNSDLHLVSHCDMKDFFSGFRRDLERMTAASYASELIDALMPPEEENLEIYELTQAFLKSLQTTRDVGKLVQTFQIKILSLSGFQPHLEACVRCTNRWRQGRVSVCVWEAFCVRHARTLWERRRRFPRGRWPLFCIFKKTHGGTRFVWG